MSDGGDELDKAFEALEAEVPNWMAKALRWLRSPGARLVRIPLGLAFIVGSFLWFLPILGLEMLPIGLLLLAQDIPFLRKPTGLFILWLVGRFRAVRRWWRKRRADAS